MTWSLTIPGEAVPKARPRARIIPGQKFAHMYTPTRSARFEDRVAYIAQQAEIPIIEGPIGVEIHAFFAWPKAKLLKTGTRARAWMPEKPDVDNLAKAVLDGLKAHFKDQQVVRLVVMKYRQEQGLPPCTTVTIIPFVGASVTSTAMEGSHGP